MTEGSREMTVRERRLAKVAEHLSVVHGKDATGEQALETHSAEHHRHGDAIRWEHSEGDLFLYIEGCWCGSGVKGEHKGGVRGHFA